ncbi:MAG: nucleotidyltransferase family protein [Deltaproteobacteria bacterium]|nr:nucleotidyltransferase family protein [Deltaproteobacteria bacterium]
MRVSALVLAAGESRRMGRAKQLLEWRGKPLLQHVLDQLHGSRIGEIILVLGYEADRIRQRVPTEGVKVALNPDYSAGLSSSIRRGLRVMDPRAEAFLIVLGDQPAVESRILNRLMEEFERARPAKKIALPTCRGIRGHPALFSAEYLPEALRLKGDVGLRQILADHPQEILEVEMGTEAILADIDTPEDFQKYFPEGQE